MIFRRATGEDQHELMLLAENYCTEMSDTFGEADKMPVLRAAIPLILDRHPVTAAVAEDIFGRLAGFALWSSFVTSSPREAEALGTYVVPSHRNEGVSAALRILALEFCKEDGIKSVTGTCLSQNEPGMRSAIDSGGKVIGHIIRWET